MPLRRLESEKEAGSNTYKYLIMQQYNVDWYGTQCPFWVLSTQFNNPDFPEPSRPEVMEVMEEAMDIDATIEGDMDIGYIKFRIKLNDYSFVSTGLWLWKIRYFKLHKKIFNMTFKEFCKKVVGKNYTTCLDMIKASRVWLALSTRGYNLLPYSIAQCVVLHKYLDDEETFFAHWELITTELQENEYSATAFTAIIEGKVAKKRTSLTFPVDLFNKLEHTAYNVGLSIIELVHQMWWSMFGKVVCHATFNDPKQLERWELDLALMIAEQDSLLQRSNP